jgi:hypothetical protein
MEQVRAKEKDIDKYSLLQTLQDGSEALYYAMLMRHSRVYAPHLHPHRRTGMHRLAPNLLLIIHYHD